MFLPEAEGPYAVGASTLRYIVDPPQTFGTSKLPDGSATLRMDALVCTVYYPAAVNKSSDTRGVDWVVRPLRHAVAGLQAALGAPKWLANPLVRLYTSHIQIPAYKDAHLLTEHAPEGGWPLVLFSHGLLGTRTIYSQLCCNLASNGYIVVALEHRDRSGQVYADTTNNPQVFLRPDNLQWETKDTSKFALRLEQVEFRKEEVYRVYSLFRALAKGEPVAFQDEHSGSADLASWVNRINYDDLQLVGHSFGGCTALVILSSPPPSGYDALPIKHGLLLDPWCEPLSIPGPMPTMERESIPLFIINSQGFTLWESHFPHVQELVEKWPAKASLVTIVGCKHETFSDAFLAVPIVRHRDVTMLRTIIALSLGFLRDSLDAALGKESTRNMEIVTKMIRKGRMKRHLLGDLEKTRSLAGQSGQVIVHQ